MNTFHRQDLPVRSLVTGHELSIPVFTFTGKKSGAKVYIQANLHGAEVQGNAVIHELMNYLFENEIQGEVVLVPQCNPYGENQKMGEYTYGRFDPTTGANWNRNHFYLTAKKEGAEYLNVGEFAQNHKELSWEETKFQFKKLMKEKIQIKKEKNKLWGEAHGQNLCLQLQELAVDSDLVIDLHTASVATNYLYAPNYARDVAKAMGVPHVLFIPESFDGAMDEANFTPWWDLKMAFAKINREIPMDFVALTYELSSQESLNFCQAKREAQKILNLFKLKKLITKNAPAISEEKKLKEGEEKNISQQWGCELKDFKNLYSPMGGLVEFVVTPGEIVKAGQVLAKILSFTTIIDSSSCRQAITEVLAPEEGIIINCFPSASILQGQSLFLLMTKTFSI